MKMDENEWNTSKRRVREFVKHTSRITPLNHYSLHDQLITDLNLE